jgi:hypothetical protein
LVRPFVRAVAGSGVAQSWDAMSRTFSLTYAPAGGGSASATEVQLPSRAYPQGFSVSVTGGCYDAASLVGRLLVQPDAGATQVSLRITSP